MNTRTHVDADLMLGFLLVAAYLRMPTRRRPRLSQIGEKRRILEVPAPVAAPTQAPAQEPQREPERVPA